VLLNKVSEKVLTFPVRLCNVVYSSKIICPIGNVHAAIVRKLKI